RTPEKRPVASRFQHPARDEYARVVPPVGEICDTGKQTEMADNGVLPGEVEQGISRDSRWRGANREIAVLEELRGHGIDDQAELVMSILAQCHTCLEDVIRRIGGCFAGLTRYPTAGEAGIQVACIGEHVDMSIG